MTRVIAGIARGRQLKAPRGLSLRPTASKVREAIFGILAARVSGARVLDLYCGIGSLGIEALSRGAAHCSFVDASARSLSLLHANLETTGFVDMSRCLKRRLPKQIGPSLGGPFDLVLSDPPYADDVVSELGARLTQTPGLLAEDAVWVHEGPSRRVDDGPVPDLAGWDSPDVRRYGDTAIWVFTVRSPV